MMNSSTCQEIRGNVFDIQRWSLHDGPGIRTVVFLKGCPLRCLWCCNPESQEPYTEIAYFKDKCIGCGRCVAECPYGAITPSPEGFIAEQGICLEKCFGRQDPPYPCTKKCYSQARKNIGRLMTVKEVLHEVLKDSLIYKQSGGGITVSGGEPMFQARFVKELLAESKANWLHTAMETCGFASWKKYEEVMEYVDFLFLDIKHFDNEKHVEFTGQGNRLILDNARRLAQLTRKKGIEMVVRIPVIPGHTDSEENIKSIVKFVATELEGVKVVELMPYHRLGRGKYASMGRAYQLYDLTTPAPGRIDELKQIVLQHGLATNY